MPRLLHTIVSFSKASAVAASVVLVGYVGYLVVAQYRAQVELQTSQRRQLAQESDKRAAAAGYFFRAQAASLMELAESREITIYFENQALGMSLEYGLSASVLAMQELFEKYQRKHKPFLASVLFLTADGRTLALSGSRAGSDGSRGWSQFVRRDSRTVFLSDTRQDTATIVISVPCIFKERLVGQVLGVIPAAQVYDHFVGTQEKSTTETALVMGDRYLYMPQAQQMLLPSALRAAPPPLRPGGLAAPVFTDEQNHDLLASRTDIPDTPLSIINYIPVSTYNAGHPRRILIITAGMAVAILGGIFFSYFQSTRYAVLQTRLEEAALREQEAEALNRTLECRIQEEIEKSRAKDMLVLQNEKLATIGQLAAGVAHEINNPMGFITSNLGSLNKYLAKIMAYLKILEAGGDAVSARSRLKVDVVLRDVGNLVTESLDGAHRVKKIVADLKVFARADKNELESADVNKILESSLNMVANQIKYVANIECHFGELTEISCYPQQLSQVFINLLTNACQALEGHGTITVRTWAAEESVWVIVSDTGNGIPEEVLGHIFEPFFTTKSVGKGTGLGLSISNEIVRRHGGSIGVTTEPGRGTDFTVRLPMTVQPDMAAG